jgi:hypothetical protein
VRLHGWYVVYVGMCAYFYVIIFPAIESNEECAEEGEIFEYQEEGDQGQANQGKPSTCFISEVLPQHYALSYSYSHCYALFFLYC